MTKVANAYYALNPAGASSTTGFQKEIDTSQKPDSVKPDPDTFEVEAIDQ